MEIKTMSEFIKYLILAIIQGLLEWLPVSSEGFIILTGVNGFGIPMEDALSIAIYFHLGTGLAVLVKYWNVYWDAITKDKEMFRFLIISTLATAVFGIPLYFIVKSLSFTGETGLIITLIIGALLIVTATLLRLGKLKGSNQIAMEDRSVKDEILVGLCQGLAILPGISRSGTTTTFLILRGYKKEDAFRMSFIISLPAVIGAVAFEILQTYFGSETNVDVDFQWWYLILILITAIIGYFTMDILLRVAKKWSFDVICYVLGGITILLVVIILSFNVY
jgi:undecaprenyl-diphosphatase